MYAKQDEQEKAAAELPSIPKGLIGQLVTSPMTAEALNPALMAFKKTLI